MSICNEREKSKCKNKMKIKNVFLACSEFKLYTFFFKIHYLSFIKKKKKKKNL
jgi:hypothetical protein